MYLLIIHSHGYLVVVLTLHQPCRTMANLSEITLQLIVKKLDQILKTIKLGRRSSDRDEEAKILEDKPVSQDQFNTAMDDVMKLVNKK